MLTRQKDRSLAPYQKNLFGNTSSTLDEPGGRAFGWRRDGREQVVDDSIGVDPFGFRVEGRHDPVPEDRRCDLAHVVDRGVDAAFEQGACLGAQNQRLAGTRAGSPGNVLPHVVRSGVQRELFIACDLTFSLTSSTERRPAGFVNRRDFWSGEARTGGNPSSDLCFPQSDDRPPRCQTG
jgi:hypothetical protein